MNLLNLLIVLPALGAAAMMAVPSHTRVVRATALAISTTIFLLSLALLPPVLADPAHFHFETDINWIKWPAVDYHVGVDGLSMWMIVVTSLLGMVATLVSWRHIHGNLRKFYAALLLLQCCVFGVLCALDLFLFYVFWEVLLLPMTFLIGIWGRERRVHASVKYFIYGMVGSLFMLTSIFFLSVKAGTLDYVDLMQMISRGQLNLTAFEELAIFLGFFVAFAVKVPLFPLHSWMPEMHSETASGGPVDIAAIMVKLGPYAMLRFLIPLFPAAAQDCAPWIVGVALIGLVVFGLIALVQTNIKRLIAYSSMSHMGLVVLGIFSLNPFGTDGAVYLMIAHAITASALFVLAGFLYDRRRSVCIADFGGVASSAPKLASIFLFVSLASMGLPLLSNFVGEFLVLQGAAGVNFVWAVFGSIGAVLSAAYMLWLYQRVFLGPVHKVPDHPSRVHHAPHFDPGDMHDLRRREWASVLPLAACILILGIGSQSMMPPISAVNAHILEGPGRLDPRVALAVPPAPHVPSATMLASASQSAAPKHDTRALAD
jgi:NADH-quinone oxidoreductase subunit M